MDKSGQIKRYVAHLGAIAFNYSMVGAILTVASLLKNSLRDLIPEGFLYLCIRSFPFIILF